MIIILAIVMLLTLITYCYLQKALFGRKPGGKRLERLKQSPNYKDGAFQNLTYTPSFTEGYHFGNVLYEFLFNRAQGRRPMGLIPSLKTDLLGLSLNEDILVWFGHSSYYIQLDGKRMLVDPVFSSNASPLKGSNKSFKGTDQYTVDDMPPIDYLFITHDHYDHADYETLRLLPQKTKTVLCGLGVGGHLEHWGFAPEKIIEKDWGEQIILEEGFVVYTTPARHFSGRALTRNNTLWLSFLLQAPSMKIFIGGDSGYDTHFAEIGNTHGPIDLAILENGQYDVKWKYIHMFPHEVLQATKDLKAKRLLPIHSAKFAMANHDWSAPLCTITALNKDINIPVLTPQIGEPVYLKEQQQLFSEWWLQVK